MEIVEITLQAPIVRSLSKPRFLNEQANCSVYWFDQEKSFKGRIRLITSAHVLHGRIKVWMRSVPNILAAQWTKKKKKCSIQIILKNLCLKNEKPDSLNYELNHFYTIIKRFGLNRANTGYYKREKMYPSLFFIANKLTFSFVLMQYCDLLTLV